MQRLADKMNSELRPAMVKRAKEHEEELRSLDSLLMTVLPLRMNGHKERVEPAEVKQARKIIERWDKEESRLACESQKRKEALRQKAKEAIYFDTPEKALAIIRQCEKMLKGCSS